MPQLEVKAVRKGGATYQVPFEVRAERKQTLGLRWLTTYSRARSERTMTVSYTHLFGAGLFVCRVHTGKCQPKNTACKV